MTALRTALVVVASGLMLAFASPTLAANNCVSAPGTSAVDQYCETVPGADGDKPSEGNPGSSTNGTTDALPASAAKQLSRPGATNAAILALVADGPANDKKKDGATSGKPGAEQTAAVDPGPSPSSDPLNAIPAALSDGPSLSVVVPLLMLGIALLIGGIAWARARSEPPGSQ